jgi:hypothetical protein
LRRLGLLSPVLAAITVLFEACHTNSDRPGVDVTLLNKTTNEVAWSEVWFGKHRIEFGILGGGGGGTYLDYNKPITENATVKLTDPDHKVREYQVSLKGIYPPKTSGSLALEITPEGVVPRFTPKHEPDKR